MNEHEPFPVDASRHEAAATWLVRLEGADATDSDWAEFETWMADPVNKRALDEIEAAVASVEDHQAMVVSRVHEPSGNVHKLVLARYVRPTTFAALAAAAAVFVFFQLKPSPAEEFSYAAPSSTSRVVVLPDASSVTLNRSAVIRVSWSTTERRVDLQRGEAAFNVVHNVSAPFIVTAGAETVRDVGTEFNVLRGGQSVTVTVRTGAVSLLAGSGSNPTFLVQGDQAEVVSNRVTTRRVDPEDVLAWRQGRLIYRDARLSAVVDDLNRYSPVPITVGDSAVAALRFSGVLTIDSPNAMTTRLEAFLPIHSEQSADGIVLRSR